MTTELTIQLMLLALTQAQQLGTLLAKAKAEGRDVTPEELDALTTADGIARKGLQDAIDAKSATQS